MKTLNADAAKKLREKAASLSKNLTKASFELAEVLYETYYGAVLVGGGKLPLWEAWGYKSWFDYVEREIELHQSRAAAYRRVYEVFMVKLDGAWDKDMMPSFTKLRALCRVVTKTNVNAWFKRAKAMSCCELEEAVQEQLYGRRRSGANRQFTAFVNNAELTRINAILEVGQQQFPNLDRRGAVLAKIVEQWDEMIAKKEKRHLKVVRAS